jgi:replicative DNA helicase
MRDVHDSLLRVPPQNLEAEQSVLGAIFLDTEVALGDALGILTADDFYRENHRVLFRAMVKLHETKTPIDAITLSAELRGSGQLEAIGGPAYIAELTTIVPTAANLRYYARIVANTSVLRKLASVATGIASTAYETGHDGASGLLDRAEGEIFKIAESQNQSSFVSSMKLTRQALEHVEFLHEHKGEITGLRTGISEIDDLTSGFQSGELIVIAARPSMGKTALALNIAMRNALDDNRPCGAAFFSLEMSDITLGLRMLEAVGRIDSAKIKAGLLSSGDLSKLEDAAARISLAPQIFVDDNADISPLQIRAKCRRLFREQKNVGLIVVDYLQLMKTADRNERRDLDVAELSRSLKALAKELEVPVIALSQLNRRVEGREDKRPVLADLRESGAIEQDADVVIFIYRDEFYKKNSSDKGTAELIVAKNRNGIANISVKTAFLPKFMLFENLQSPS